jgi:hypothetical protein
VSLRHFLAFLLASAVIFSVPSHLVAQDKDVPKLEVFGGYSWYRAGGAVDAVKVPDFNAGWAGQVTFNSNSWFGLAVDVNGHYNHTANAHSVALGPQFKLHWRRLVPFGEILLGVQDFGPKEFRSQNAAAYIFGGGVDLKITPRFSIRPFQIDYISTYYNALSAQGQTNPFNGFRQQAGMVFNFGLPSPEGPVSARCGERPPVVDAGAPVEISVTLSGFLPKRVLKYSYTSTGGAIKGEKASAELDTDGLAPGTYTVTAEITDNGKGSHQQAASCQVAFKVNEPVKPHPPTLSVSAAPDSLKSGDASTITATASSPDSRPLSYNCIANDGRLTGTGAILTIDTAGVPDSTITVNCTVSDDRNLTASAHASVRVHVAPPPLGAKGFGKIEFKHDMKRPTRVDNEAKGELDRYADAMISAPDIKGVLVGYATTKEAARQERAKNMPEVAAQRAINTKDYLVKGKGIDAARIEVRTGKSSEQKVELWIVPTGAIFPAADTKVVDESKVKAVPRIALKVRKVVHKKAHTSRRRP